MPDISSNLQLWTSRVGGHTLKIEQDTIQLLTLSEKQHLDAIKNTNKRREFLLSRALMRHALSQLFELPSSDWAFVYRPNSAPMITNLPDTVFTSLSHSNGHILFATSTFPIGIDIELVKNKDNIFTLAEVFMSEKEIITLKNHAEGKQADYFYRIWCAKESYYKAMPSKQSTMAFNSFSIFKHIKNNKNWCLIEEDHPPFLFSLFVENKAQTIHMSRREFHVD